MAILYIPRRICKAMRRRRSDTNPLQQALLLDSAQGEGEECHPPTWTIYLLLLEAIVTLLVG